MAKLLKITTIVCASTIWLTTFPLHGISHSQDTWYSYTVQLNENGIALVTADLNLPTPLDTSYHVLSDYPHWPTLFAHEPILNTIQRTGDRVMVDMTIPGIISSLDLKLVTETQETPPTQLTTTFIRGDFDRYAWVWTLSSSEDRQHTQATLELQVKPSFWTPQWLFSLLLKRELKEHFFKLRQQVLARQRAMPATQVTSATPTTP